MTGLNRLTARTVETITKPGRLADGGNLYLNVTASGAKSWVFYYKHAGRQREMGLGRYGRAGGGGVSLAAAREKAAVHRAQIAAGKDPLAERDRPPTGSVTFGQVADDLIASKESSWKNEAHRRQWRQTLADYAAALRPMPVDTITTEDVLQVLKPIWTTMPDTASRTRGRIEAVLSAAKARGLRSGDNPAAWKDNLKHLLPPPRKLTRGHHRAMPYQMVPDFVKRLRRLVSVSARATEFAIATAARSAEVLGARWDEIDFDAGIWTVPAERMKRVGSVAREHRKPLTPHCVVVLRAMEAVRRSEFVFPGAKEGRPLSEMALEMTLRRLKVDDIATPHGFRSSFRDWVGEQTTFPRELAEEALAHQVGDETERAYRRGDALAKRRTMMSAWSDFLLDTSSTSVSTSGARST